MVKKTILENGYASLWYHPESNIVHHQFHKFIHGEEFRNVLNQGLSIFEEERSAKWLSDDRKNSVLPQSDYEWGQGDWTDSMIRAGWKYWAIILPETAAGKASMQRVIDSYAHRNIQIEIFETPEAGLEWLRSVD